MLIDVLEVAATRHLLPCGRAAFCSATMFSACNVLMDAASKGLHNTEDALSNAGSKIKGEAKHVGNKLRFNKEKGKAKANTSLNTMKSSGSDKLYAHEAKQTLILSSQSVNKGSIWQLVSVHSKRRPSTVKVAKSFLNTVAAAESSNAVP
eukprot:19020-Heterococcus_DN1.PRE.2